MSNVVTVNGVLQGCVVPANGKVIHIIDSWIGKDVTITSTGSCVLSGIQLSGVCLSVELVGECVWQMYSSEGMEDTVTCYGMSDDLAATHLEPEATIFNTKWSDFFSRTTIGIKDLWSDPDSKNQTVLTAKLFPTNLPVVEQIEMIAVLARTATDGQFQEKWKSKLLSWRTCQRASIQSLMRKCETVKLLELQEKIYMETMKKFISDTADEMGGKSLLPLFTYVATSKL